MTSNTRTYVLTLLFCIAFLPACSSMAPQKEASLYERLGGKSAIAMVVNDFVDTVGADSRITNEKVAARLEETSIPVLKMLITDQVCMATGGPCVYTGRDMVESHKGLEITNQEFDWVVDDLVKTLDKYKVPEREKNELIDLLAPMRSDIVQAM